MRRAFFILAMVGSGACDSGTAAKAVDYAPLLKAMTEQVVLPATQTFAEQADGLQVATAALTTNLNAPGLGAAQLAWSVSRRSWRNLDAIYFGPTISAGITDRIDATPVDDSGIDAIVNGTQTIDAALVANLGGKLKGFLGIEYLLFYQNSASAALTRLQGPSGPRMLQLAAAMSVELAASAHQLADAWDPAHGNYAGQVETAGNGSTVYAQELGAVDDYVGGVAYALELVVGTRLANPLGLKSASMTPNPALDPTTASDSAVADMTGSLSGVTALYATAGGFNVMVNAMSNGLGTLATTQSGACTTSVSAIPAPFATSLVSDTKVVQSAYDACKTWKDDWSTDITSALGATVQPDNDGD